MSYCGFDVEIHAEGHHLHARNCRGCGQISWPCRENKKREIFFLVCLLVIRENLCSRKFVLAKISRYTVYTPTYLPFSLISFFPFTLPSPASPPSLPPSRWEEPSLCGSHKGQETAHSHIYPLGCAAQSKSESESGGVLSLLPTLYPLFILHTRLHSFRWCVNHDLGIKKAYKYRSFAKEHLWTSQRVAPGWVLIQENWTKSRGWVLFCETTVFPHLHTF